MSPGSRRRFLCLLAAVFLVSALSAQEAPRDAKKPAVAAIFPLTLVLEGAEYAGAGVWRPDWPLELPPDAFKTLSGEVSRTAIEGESFSLSLSFTPGGLVEKFPFALNGRMAQAGLVYNDAMEIRELTIAVSTETSASGEDTYRMEVLEYEDSCPALVRGSLLDAWYFIYFSRNPSEIRETWYDEEGNFLGAYVFPLTGIGKTRRIRAVEGFSAPSGAPLNGREFHYDSRGFLTETSGPDGLYKVLYYREDLPRYWERRERGRDNAQYPSGEGNYSLQWDERGLLVRLTGEPENEGPFVDYRYEYTLDEQGNWIERREIRMVRGLGLLLPSPGTTFRRVLEYSEPL